MTTIAITSAADIDLLLMPKREWLVPGRFAPRFPTLTLSPGGIGKSMFAIHEHVGLAAGRDDIAGMPLTSTLPVNSWYYNTEDPLDELQRRFAAALLHAGVKKDMFAAVWGRLFISSGRESPLRFAELKRGEVVINQAAIDQVEEMINKNNIKLFTIDPFVRCHGLDENDNPQMDQLAVILAGIAHRTNCSLHIVHHDGKGGGKKSDRDVDTARGASAVVSAMRIVHKLRSATDEEAEQFGIGKKNAWKYIKLSSGKANMGPQDDAFWLAKSGYELPNGDVIGVVSPWKPPERSEEYEEETGKEKKRGRGRPKKERKFERTPTDNEAGARY